MKPQLKPAPKIAVWNKAKLEKLNLARTEQWKSGKNRIAYS